MEVFMKRFGIVLSLFLFLGLPSISHSKTPLEVINQLSLQNIQNVINWKVGEWTDYDLEFFIPGSMRKEVTSDEGDALWMTQTMDMGFLGKVDSKVKISRKTGEILELWVNGQKQEVPHPKIDIVKQEEDRITVPAGTFDTIKVTVKDRETGKLTIIWLNPRDIPMDGTVQMETESEYGQMTLKLKDFGFAK